jgi:choline dehydrogenase
MLIKFSWGILYPRGATLGGSAQVNAMNFAWAPDNEWDYIANLTGDETWGHENMRQHLIDLENCTYVPQGTSGHGYDGYLEVRLASSMMVTVTHFLK